MGQIFPMEFHQFGYEKSVSVGNIKVNDLMTKDQQLSSVSYDIQGCLFSHALDSLNG
jgi:hypothetical protein